MVNYKNWLNKFASMIDPVNFEKAAIHMLVGILRSVPFLHVRSPLGPYRSEGELFPSDGIVKVEYQSGDKIVSWYLVLEVKSNAQLRDVRTALDHQMSIDRIRRFAEHMGAPGYGVFASQYLTQSAKDYCKERGVGYFDLSGNCYLVFDNVFIEKDAPLTVAPEKKRLRSLFSSKSARVIRRLLQNPLNEWRVQSLASDADVSKATVSLLKDKLLESGYAESNEDNSFRLLNPEDLLQDWSRHYSAITAHEHVELECYARGDLADNEKHFVNFCEQSSIEYAFTMFSAAKRVAPFTRGISRSYAYILSPKILPVLAEELGFKPVPSGGNFRLIDPSDNEVLYGSYTFENHVLVSNVQLYLDLSRHKGRGEENAEFLLEQRIRKSWQSSTK